MPSSAQFQTIYRQLNAQQKKAVDQIDGPVMLVAGPGTGKTQVLAARVANILQKTDTNPSSILALTFTESAAAQMRQRLVGMIGRTGYYVNISTFHAFCSQVIKQQPEYFPLDRDSEPLSDLQKYNLFENIIKDLKLEVLKPINRTDYYLPAIMTAIANLKREGFFPDDFEQAIKKEATALHLNQDKFKKYQVNKQAKNITKWNELLSCYQEYQIRLRKNLSYDFEDMITLVIEAFQQHELLLREYQENLHYFLVDEYQDANSAQNKIVDLLAAYWQMESGQANVFVVGDPNQSIYRFQGASLENVLGFVKRYPQAKVMNLTKGYRCSQTVYNAAARVIGNNQLTVDSTTLGGFSFSQPLKSVTKQNLSITIYQAPSQVLETVYVAEAIVDLKNQGVPLDHIAILYRHNRDLAEISETLDKWQLKYQIMAGNDLLQDESIRQLLTLMEVVLQIRQATEDEKLFEVMRYEWIKLNPTIVMMLGRMAGKTKLSLVDIIKHGWQHFVQFDQINHHITSLEFEHFNSFLAKLEKWGKLDSTIVFTHWFETLIKESGYLDWILSSTLKTEQLIYLNSLFNEVKILTKNNLNFNLEKFLKAVATMRAHKIRLRTEDLNVKKDTIHLSTVHQAKGLEWDHVFVIHCYDTKWGNNLTRELLPLPIDLLENTNFLAKEINEDERRIFYVALTRSKTKTYLSYPKTLITSNRSKDLVSSMFIEELMQHNEFAVKIDQVTATTIEAQADQFLARLLAPAIKIVRKNSERDFFANLVKDFSLSVTALNTYLKSPSDFIQNVLLKVPRAKAEPMVFGSAVHVALESLFKHMRDKNIKPAINQFLSVFTTALHKELITSTDFKRRLSYGKDILTKYYNHLDETTILTLDVERFFGKGWSKTYLDDIHLTGRIDRIDWLDKVKRQVKVIDYKTGKPKSTNYIEGKIASANLSAREQTLPDNLKGAYKRQLLFYKLLTVLDDTFIPQVEQGEFDFIEPSSNGKFVKRTFTLLDQDVEDLKELIKMVMQEIRSLKFLDED